MLIFLDAVTPLERIKISGQIAAKSKELQGELPALTRLRVSRDLLALLALLDESIPQADDDLSDDPNAENYRYRDTGHIAGSRKELAQAMIRQAKADGRQLLASDLDWEEIESNPRAAAELITKSNLFGQTDWEALQQAGMEPGAGFLLDRIYASIATQPNESTPRARQDYAIALKTIRERLESCKTVQDVLDVLAEIRSELEGSQLNAEESGEYEAVQVQIDALTATWRALNAEREALSKAAHAANGDIWVFQRKQDQRTRRGWKPDEELQAQIDALKPAQEAALAAISEWEAAHPEFKDEYTTTRSDGGSSTSLTGGLRADITKLRRQQSVIEKAARARNISESPVTRGWLTFGERFFKVLNYRHYTKGSDAFASHVTNARNGKVTDWAWASSEKPTVVKKATKQQINFTLKVAENFQRIGGTPVKVDSTFALKDMLGFRDVQSGNWVLKDPDSARFHVQQTAGAMLDLSDILGIDPKALGLGGRLGMAFGARGTGNAGGSTARATYEGVHRVINLTKMGGGGSLGHEWFHAIDDMLGELSTGETTKARNYASIDHTVLPAGALQHAMLLLNVEMMRGTRKLTETIKVTDKDRQLAKHNIDGGYLNAVAKGIKAAGSLEAAVTSVDTFFKGRNDKSSEKKRKQWRTIAAAYYAEEGAEFVKAATGPAVSDFYAEAVILDDGQAGKYWSRPHEMAARAFQSYLEDRLDGMGRKNDYLSSFADNKFHYDPFFGVQWNPYPEGEERKRINEAFDTLFESIRDERVFEKATANKALLDSIFGPDDTRAEFDSLLHDLRSFSPDRTAKAQRLVELIPQVVFDSLEEEDAAVAAAAAILEEVAQ